MGPSGHALEYHLGASPPDEAMERLLAAFPNKPLQTRTALLELFERDRELFVASALRYLEEGRTGHAYRFLLAQLLESGVFVELLLERAQRSTPEAAGIMRAAMRLEPQFDIRLMRWILDSAKSEMVAVLARKTETLLDLLSQASPGNRMLPVVVQFLRNNGGHVRSKAALIMAQRSQRVDLALADADPRVRANAIEALWGMDTPNARRTLKLALDDAHNRVRGNAILGLFRVGDLSVVPDLLSMARHEEPNFRSTAAWVMGESADRAFLPRLNELAADPEAVVKEAAARALKKLETSIKDSPLESALPVRILRVADLGKGRKRLTLCLHIEKHGGGASLHARVTENGEPVPEVQIRRTEHASLALGLALPEAWPDEIQAAIRRLLAIKRPSDRLAAVCYSPRSARTAAPKLVYSSVPHLPSRAAANADAMAGAAGAIAALLDTPTGLAAHSDVILFAQDAAGLGPAAIARLSQKADQLGAFLHAVAAPEAAPEDVGTLGELCSASGGLLLPAANPAAYPKTIEALYHATAHQTEIIYRSPAVSGGPLRIEIEIISGGTTGRARAELHGGPTPSPGGERIWHCY
jgi:HEAT repeat protein